MVGADEECRVGKHSVSVRKIQLALFMQMLVIGFSRHAIGHRRPLGFVRKPADVPGVPWHFRQAVVGVYLTC